MSRWTWASHGAVLALLVVLAWPQGAAASPRPNGAETVLPADIIPTPQPPIDFGKQLVGTATAPHDYVYTNSTGSSQAMATARVGTNAADFAIVGDTCNGANIANGATCTVSITFTPSGEYSRTATLQIFQAGTAEYDVPLAGAGLLPPSAVVWGTARNVGSAYTSTNGTALARTVSGTTQILHAIVERYDVARWGVYYRRSTNGGSTWPLAVRVNPSTQFGVRSSEAAAGSHVYVVWSTFASANPSKTQPRPLWFRSNATNGSGTWTVARRLTSSTGRIDYPKVAAAGSNVYIAYTDAVTGYVYLKVSHNYGSTWTTVKLGSTTRTGWSGRLGVPAVAASGGTVAVAWISSTSGSVRVRTSTTRGATWSGTSTVGSGAVNGTWPSIALSGTRLAVGWTASTSLKVRIRTGSTWGPVRSVTPSAGADQAYTTPGIAQVVLNGSARVAVVGEWCWAGCAATDPVSAYRSDVVWRESANNGLSWAHSQNVVPSDASPFNEYSYAYLPSVVWPAAGTRYVMAGHWYAPNLLDNVVVRTGTGLP